MSQGVLMLWDGLKIKRLRRLLNWTPLQMAQRLGLKEAYLKALEFDKEVLSPEISVQLDHLQASIDRHIKIIRSQPIIDSCLDQSKKEQVTSSEIDEFILELKKIDN